MHISIYQAYVKDWMIRCFGKEILNNRQERAFRFLEEALELVQALDVTKEDVLKLVDYTYGRPKGEVYVEIGQTALVLSALASACNIHFDDACVDEYRSAEERIDKIREKWKTKPIKGPIPATELPNA